ncbi:hypothetical protein CBR_g34382 [Chara braunii]|uniref:DUF7869 domain-containing protein n=1 Tax=Chara braunii TaxID=69332 RepID=A0A388LIR3_CHABU|nr:hypothetical protein CBR_g34382 [Chara braunii]|eukprot:GBG82102.1 hypothetical protein CBR_g34382 [Chara braunii]
MSKNFVVKETLYDSVAQELCDNDTEEEEPSDDVDEEGESSDDDDEEEETSEDADSEDTDFEDDEGKNESGIDVDMFKKSLSGELLGERRGLYNKSSKSEKPPYNMGKHGRNARVYNKKANYHVNMKNVELVLKEDCCKANCYKKFTAVDVFYKRENFWAMKQLEQLNFFLAEMRVASYFSDEGDLEVLRVTFNGVKVCTKAWGKLYGCSTTRIAKIRKEFREGMVLYEHANKGSVRLSPSSQQILAWLHEYFQYNKESMPNSDQFHLSDTLRRRDVYDFFKRDCKELYTNKTLPSRSGFMTIWRVHCPKVLIPALKRFSVCSTCLKIKTCHSQATSVFEREMFGKALEKHQLMQAEERQNLSKHRHKASSHPSEYVAMIIDGMDQSKSVLPHFTEVPKDSKLKEGNFVKVHVVGAKVPGLSSNASATVFFDNFKSDSNCMLIVLHRQISQLPVPFPSVLYLTLDNTSKENKNKFVLSYLVFLVKMRVFSKVKLNFLLVGHTHEDIDQMFSCFSRKQAAHGTFDLLELQHVIRESYKVEQDHGVHVEEMTKTMDWKLYVQDHLHNVNDISFNQHFRIKRNDNGEVRIWNKQYHNSQWQPNDKEGLDIFKSEPTGQVQASPKHAIRSLEARYRLTCWGEDEKRDKVVSSEGHVYNKKAGGSSKFKVDDDVFSIAALKANVHAPSHYAQPHNIEWWNKFIATQETFDLEDTNLKESFV